VGVFYNRPSPEAAPFVQAGSAVSAGNVLGLVEVMKSFNQIIYGGPGLPERGEVAQVLVSDNAEVVFGQVLFRIRPVAL
jgi:biotin carboxyl carrier protein